MPDAPDAPYRDLMLASFVNLANQAAIGELGVSLLVSSGWLTGQLVGARLWFEGLAQSLDATGSTGGFGDVMRMVGAQVYPSESERMAAGDVEEETNLPAFVHLKDAYVIHPDGRRVPTHGGYVRVRVDAVAGWMLGRIGPSPT
ncbi:MAG: hypothetical protein ACRD12_18605 [Acidimicrobiales bacterium]